MNVVREAPEGIWGSLGWLINAWFISLTPSTLLYVRLTFWHNQTRWSHVSYTCAVPHHEYLRVDGVVYSTNPIFSVGCPRVLYMCFPYATHAKDGMFHSRWTCHGLRCHHMLPYVCVSHYKYVRQGYTPFKRRVSEVGCCPCSDLMHGCHFYSERQCMWTLPWVLAQKVLFCKYTNHVS
jgi:hypothetical protein